MEDEIQPLPWDSRFFGFPVGRLRGRGFTTAQLRDVICGARHQGWRLIYWYVNPCDAVSAASARTLGIVLIDRKVQFSQAVPSVLPAEQINSRPVRQLTSRLLELARHSGQYSRFRLDPGFEPGTYERLYAHWIRRSISGHAARRVLVYPGQSQAEALGMLTLAQQPTHATIGLLAVQENYRSQGIGKQLVRDALHYAHAWQLPEIRVTTQLDNEGACRFYEREGFERVHEEHVYHLWL